VASRRESWPESIGEIQTNAEAGRLSVGVELRLGEEDQIVATTVTPVVRDDGSLWLEGARTRAGRLDIPSGWTVSRLEQALPGDLRNRAITTRLLLALRGQGPALAEPTIELQDNRRVRLLAATPTVNRLALTFITERSDDAMVER